MSRSFRVVDDFVRFTIDPNHPLPYLDIQYCRAMRFFAKKVMSSRKEDLDEMYKVLTSDSDRLLALNRVCADMLLYKFTVWRFIVLVALIGHFAKSSPLCEMPDNRWILNASEFIIIEQDIWSELDENYQRYEVTKARCWCVAVFLSVAFLLWFMVHDYKLK